MIFGLFYFCGILGEGRGFLFVSVIERLNAAVFGMLYTPAPAPVPGQLGRAGAYTGHSWAVHRQRTHFDHIALFTLMNATK